MNGHRENSTKCVLFKKRVSTCAACGLEGHRKDSAKCELFQYEESTTSSKRLRTSSVPDQNAASDVEYSDIDIDYERNNPNKDDSNDDESGDETNDTAGNDTAGYEDGDGDGDSDDDSEEDVDANLEATRAKERALYDLLEQRHINKVLEPITQENIDRYFNVKQHPTSYELLLHK